MKNSDVTRTRKRSQNVENKKIEIFDSFIAREFSQFERMTMKTAILNNEKISIDVKRVIHQANSVSKRRRERERERRARKTRENENRARNNRDRNNRNV